MVEKLHGTARALPASATAACSTRISSAWVPNLFLQRLLLLPLLF
jgi:hypothetical protein